MFFNLIPVRFIEIKNDRFFFVIPALYLENKKERIFKNISFLIAQGGKYFGCNIQNTLGVKVQNLKKGFNTGGT